MNVGTTCKKYYVLKNVKNLNLLCVRKLMHINVGTIRRKYFMLENIKN